jgi:hypothetical protein
MSASLRLEIDRRERGARGAQVIPLDRQQQGDSSGAVSERLTEARIEHATVASWFAGWVSGLALVPKSGRAS